MLKENNALIILNQIEIIFLTNTKNFDLIVIVKKILKKQKRKFLFKSKFRKIDMNSKLHRFVNVENCENFKIQNDIKNVSSKNLIFIVFSLKLRSVFKIFQKINFFAIQIRFLIESISIKQNKNMKINENSQKIVISTI